MRPLRSLTLLLLAAAVGLCAPAAAQAKRKVPRGWFGTVVVDNGLLSNGTLMAKEAKVMAANGVESMRVPVYWNQMQPYQGNTIDFTRTDAIVAAAARNNISVMPSVMFAPEWARSGHSGITMDSPKNPADYTRFLAALYARYGTNSAFFRDNGLPYRPVRTWQIWNEPDHPNFWRRKPSWSKEYAALARASYRALKKLNKRNTVVLGSLTGVAWGDLRMLFKAGVKHYFDVAAIHPYTKEPKNVIYTVKLVRKVMAQYHYVKPIALTEVSWPASQPNKVKRSKQLTFATTEKGQISKLKSVVGLLVKNRRALKIWGVYWYSWTSSYSRQGHAFDWTGLRQLLPDGTVRSKPILGTYRRLARPLEGR